MGRDEVEMFVGTRARTPSEPSPTMIDVVVGILMYCTRVMIGLHSFSGRVLEDDHYVCIRLAIVAKSVTRLVCTG